MVQRTRTWQQIALLVILRIVLICLTVYVAAYTLPIALEILRSDLGYQNPNTFWGGNITDDFESLALTLPFWSGIIFGALGRKVDYIIIGLFLALGIWEYTGTETTTAQMYLGLAAATVIGNLVGFTFKLLRQKFLPKLKV